MPDIVEVFRGEGSLSLARDQMGFITHPVFILDGPRGYFFSSDTMLHIIGLICRRVVKYVHVAPSCSTFGTMRRPRLRSKRFPWGFEPGNMFALRAGLILHLCAAYDTPASAEQPAGSVMFRLDIFVRLLKMLFYMLKFCFCTLGTSYKKDSRWLVNNPDLLPMQGSCTCPYRGRHVRLEKTFTQESLLEFTERCRPSCIAVFRREPRVGEPHPLPAIRRLLELQGRRSDYGREAPFLHRGLHTSPLA